MCVFITRHPPGVVIPIMALQSWPLAVSSDINLRLIHPFDSTPILSHHT